MSESSSASILSRIRRPPDVAGLTYGEKKQLAQELRDTIIRTVSNNGGHLAPSLGVVELMLALLAIFDPRNDRLVWDVGHQAYAWKLLTGRADQFATLRRLGGLSGFPRREESEYDHFGVGHSSTSISAALGMAMARDLSSDPAVRASHVLAVIGDGALTAGMAFEGLNQAGSMGRRLIVVLNDNEMSISRNVGALSLFLSRNMERGWARRLRREVKDWLRSIPGIGEEMAEYAHRTHRSLKTAFTPGMLFEAFRFNYIGPVNGHDIEELEKHLRMAASIDDQPVLLHVLTKKGRGYLHAEADPARFHGLGRFDLQSGEPLPGKPASGPAWTDVFGRTLCELAERDRRVVAITAAMAAGTGTAGIRQRFPDRFVDVGICEQHAITFAAGLATQGLRPFVALYSTFAQRAYDQIAHDVCLQKLPVTICLDRAGLVGEDGPTHHGVFDIAFLRHIPNITMLAPRNGTELERALHMALAWDGPLSIRYPRGKGPAVTLSEDGSVPAPHVRGEGDVLYGSSEGGDVLVIAIGSMVQPALEAAEALQQDGLRVTVFDPWWIKPLPEAQLVALASRFPLLVTVEEGVLAGGFGSAVEEVLDTHDVLQARRLRRIGIPDSFVEHGSQDELRHLTGLDAEGIARVVRELYGSAEASRDAGVQSALSGA